LLELSKSQEINSCKSKNLNKYPKITKKFKGNFMQSKLFAPLKIGGIEIKNRIIMAPMCMYEVKKEDGRPRCFHKLHYATRAIGALV